MTTPPHPLAVRFDDRRFCVDLADGRTLCVPLDWFPRLKKARPAQREALQLSRSGLHWAELDEDITIAALLAGRGEWGRMRKDAGWLGF